MSKFDASLIDQIMSEVNNNYVLVHSSTSIHMTEIR